MVSRCLGLVGQRGLETEGGDWGMHAVLGISVEKCSLDENVFPKIHLFKFIFSLIDLFMRARVRERHVDGRDSGTCASTCCSQGGHEQLPGEEGVLGLQLGHSDIVCPQRALL